MTVEEVFKELSAHMVEGMMIHDSLANYYDFLGLRGYKRCHEYHFLSETCGYRRLNRYYINRYSKLIQEKELDNPEVIPDSWYSHIREDVDTSTKKNAVKIAVEKWVEWEKSTLDLYQRMYKELMNIGEVASAIYLNNCIADVECELKKAKRKHICLNSINYDLIYISDEQTRIHDYYKELTEKVGEHLC